MIEHLDLQTALNIYCDPNSNIQSQEHVRPFHFYSAARLVLEGGFEPVFCPAPHLAAKNRLWKNSRCASHPKKRTNLKQLYSVA